MAKSKAYNLDADKKSGAKRDLPRGFVAALKLRHPADASEETKAAADWALQRLVDVASGKVSYRQAPSVIKAVVQMRDEICGPIPKDLNVKGQLTLEQLLARVDASEEPGEEPR